MFSIKEKQKLAEKIEKLLLDLHHPEMPKGKPMFELTVQGKEPWSFASIKPNWTFSDKNPPGINPWNESARELLKKKKQ